MSLLDFFHRKSSSEKHENHVIAAIDTELMIEPLSDTKGEAGEAADKKTFDFHSIELCFTLAQSIHQDYLRSCIKDQSVEMKESLLNEFAHELIYDDEVRVKSTPNMPTILPQLMQCLRDENTLKSTYVDLISQDPLLAASVLRTSRSALYNPSGRPIDNFERAVVVLGVAGLKVIACTSLLGSVVSSSKEPLVQSTLWPYTLHTAVIAQLLAEDSASGFTAYLSGLFHSIGEMAFLEQVSIDDSLSLNIGTYAYLHEQYFERLTLAILKDWELPEDIMDQVRSAAVTPAIDGKVKNAIEVSSYLAKLIYLYQHKVWSAEQVEEAVLACNLTIEQLDWVISLSEQQVSNT